MFLPASALALIKFNMAWVFPSLNQTYTFPIITLLAYMGVWGRPVAHYHASRYIGFPWLVCSGINTVKTFIQIAKCIPHYVWRGQTIITSLLIYAFYV